MRNLNYMVAREIKCNVLYLLLVEKQFWVYSLYQLNHYWHEQ